METAKDKNPEAYDEGRSAARAGRSLGDNPYWYDCIPKATAWEDGWFDAHYQMDVDIQTIEAGDIPNLCVVTLDYRPSQGCISVRPHECSRPAEQTMCRHFMPRDDISSLCYHGSVCCTSQQASTEATLRALDSMIRAATRLVDELTTEDRPA